MTATTMATIERSGPAVLTALLENRPEDAARFKVELRAALSDAAADLDLAPTLEVLARWHALATMAANPLSAEEVAQLDRARAGDFTGWWARDEGGSAGLGQCPGDRGPGIPLSCALLA